MKLTVVSICLNAERFIAQMLSSVSRQTWLDREHIIVDGGSTDATMEIVYAHAAEHPGCIVLSGPDKGISDAMNKGLAAATGDVVAFLHADDLYPNPDVLAQVAETFIINPRAEWVTGALRQIDSFGNMIRVLPVRRWSYARLVRGNVIYHPATFVKRKALVEVGGFNTSLRYAMDYDLWLRLGLRTAPVLLNNALACFRIHEGSVSVRGIDDAFREEFLVRCRHLKDKPLHRFMHLIYYGLKYFPNRLSVRK